MDYNCCHASEIIRWVAYVYVILNCFVFMEEKWIYFMKYIKYLYSTNVFTFFLKTCLKLYILNDSPCWFVELVSILKFLFHIHSESEFTSQIYRLYHQVFWACWTIPGVYFNHVPCHSFLLATLGSCFTQCLFWNFPLKPSVSISHF